MQLHPICQDLRRVRFELGTYRYGVPGRLGSEQSTHFAYRAFDIDPLAFSRCARFVKGAQTVDDIGRTVSLLLDPGGCRARSFDVWRNMAEPSQTGAGACDRGGNRLLYFMGQRGG